MKKLTIFFVLATASCFANITNMDTGTGVYQVDKYGAPKAKIKTKPRFAPTEQDMSGNSQPRRNF